MLFQFLPRESCLCLSPFSKEKKLHGQGSVFIQEEMDNMHLSAMCDIFYSV